MTVVVMYILIGVVFLQNLWIVVFRHDQLVRDEEIERELAALRQLVDPKRARKQIDPARAQEYVARIKYALQQYEESVSDQ